jgi:hypothetical protein
VDRRVEQIDADEREIRRRVFGLLDEPQNVPRRVDFGHTEPMWIGDVREQDLRRRNGAVAVEGERAGLLPGRGEPVDEAAQVLLQQVVAEIHDELVVAEELAGDQHAVREAARGVLVDVLDVHAEVGAVAHSARDGRTLTRDDDPDVADAGRRHLLEPVEEDGLVRDGHELLRARVRDGAQARAFAPREDQTLHRRREYGSAYAAVTFRAAGGGAACRTRRTRRSRSGRAGASTSGRPGRG